MSTDIPPPQSSDLDGLPFRIRMPDYVEPHMAALPPEMLNVPLPMTSSESPELSAFEIADIQASEAEFAAGKTEIYNNPQDLLAALHASRERHRRGAGGQ